MKRRLETHLTEIPEGLSENQFGFRRGRSAIDAVEKVLSIVNSNESRPWRRRDLCAIVSIDVANAFNTVPWDKIGDALISKNTPTYLIRIIRDYLRERLLLTGVGGINVTSGVPQGSVIGPDLWNLFYDDLLRQPRPDGIEIIAFADDIAIVGSGVNTDALEASINFTLGMVGEWMRSNGLNISVSKTVAMMMTSKRRYRRPQFILLNEILELKDHIRYLGIELSSKLSFIEHMKLAGEKATKTTAALSRLMPNIGGPRPIKRKLLASVVHSQLLYAAPVWCSSLVFHNHRQLLLGPQRIMAMRVASAYRTVSTAAILVVTGIVPVHLMASGRCELRRLQKTGVINAKRVIDDNVWGWWQQEWDDERATGQWTKRLIPDVRRWASRAYGATGYFLTQFLTGHGCFQAYLHRFAIVDSPSCRSCGDPVDNAEHTFFRCGRWAKRLMDLESEVAEEVNPETIVSIMLSSREKWQAVEQYITSIMDIIEKEDQQRQRDQT